MTLNRIWSDKAQRSYKTQADILGHWHVLQYEYVDENSVVVSVAAPWKPASTLLKPDSVLFACTVQKRHQLFTVRAYAGAPLSAHPSSMNHITCAMCRAIAEHHKRLAAR